MRAFEEAREMLLPFKCARRGGQRLGMLWLVILLSTVSAVPAGRAAEPIDNMMSSGGWLQQIFITLENEAIEDVRMLPEAPGAIEREWRTFDKNGSSLGALVNTGWVSLAALLALLAEKAAARLSSRQLRRRMRTRPEGPTVPGLLLLLFCDVVGLAAFVGVFVYSRHWLTAVGVATPLIIVSAHILIRWRIAAVVFAVLLRPRDPVARLIEMTDREARRLSRFLSATVLGIVTLVGFGRYGLMDEDSGAPHVVALIVVCLVCALDTLIVFRARAVAEALIRGCGSGVIGAVRAAVARVWPAIGMAYVAGVF